MAIKRPPKEPLCTTTVSVKLTSSQDAFLDELIERVHVEEDASKSLLIRWLFNQVATDYGYKPPSEYSPPVSKQLDKLLHSLKYIKCLFAL